MAEIVKEKGRIKRIGVFRKPKKKKAKKKSPWANRKQEGPWKECRFKKCRSPHRETLYKGYCSENCQKKKLIDRTRGYQFDLKHPVRSGWERRYAEWLMDIGYYLNLDYKGWKQKQQAAKDKGKTPDRRRYYFYEPKRFLLGGIAYVPDFYLSDTNIWIEVKGLMSEKDKLKIKLFREKTKNRLIVVDEKFFKAKYSKTKKKKTTR